MYNKVKNIEWCCDLAKDKGGSCLSTEYKNVKKLMLWECAKGHQWKSNTNNIKRGSWCPFCAGIKKKTIEWCCNLAKEKGGSCLSTEYKNVKELMLWECARGHLWKAITDSIQQGYWCPVCAGNQRKNIEWCCDLAKDKGGSCLSTEYKNSSSSMYWRCSNGHQWKSNANNIERGHWCPQCADRTLNIDDCMRIAISNNGKCLSETYINTKTKMEWMCEKGHRWFAVFKSIRRGTWCPECKNKTQRKLKQIIMEILNLSEEQVKCDFNEFNWLRNPKTGSLLYIDIWVPKIKLAIEYDGEQHFMPIKFGGKSDKMATKRFAEQVFRDKVKDNLIAKHKNDVSYFIRFDYKSKLIKNNVIMVLKERGIDV